MISIYIISIQNGKKKGEADNVLEEMTKSTQNLFKNTKLQIQEVKKTPKSVNLKKWTPRHIKYVIKLLKTEDKENLENMKRNDTLSLGKNQFELL
jgi:hypothetical protein